jgi:hypothetical protein
MSRGVIRENDLANAYLYPPWWNDEDVTRIRIVTHSRELDNMSFKKEDCAILPSGLSINVSDGDYAGRKFLITWSRLAIIAKFLDPVLDSNDLVGPYPESGAEI